MDSLSPKRVTAFLAVSDSGERLVIEVFQTFREASDADGVELVAVGPQSLRTRDGRTVRRIEKGRYEFACKPWVQLTSDDRRAI